MHKLTNILNGIVTLGLALGSLSAVAQTDIDAAMTVDNQFTAYLSTDDAVQGTQIGTGNDWQTTYQFSSALTPGVTNYLHIVATDLGAPAAFIGEFHLGNSGFEFANGAQTLLTNTTNWQVSTTGFGANYQTPSDLGADGSGPWGNRPSIADTARFIWHPVGANNTVYFSTAIVPAGEVGTTRATFEVTKDFTDDNPAEVEVTISCFTGLPLNQSASITEDDVVTFVVTDFDESELDCSVSEGSLDGYTPHYSANGNESEGTAEDDEDGCHFTNAYAGDEFSCSIENDPDPVDVYVCKEWVYSNAGEDEVSDEFRVNLSCSAEIQGGYQTNGGWVAHWNSSGDGCHTFVVNAEYGGDSCNASEQVFDSAVESDDSDCQGLSIDIAQGAECTIVNTVFFEGIPTLSQYGLALLALMMLGVGFAGFRRFA